MLAESASAPPDRRVARTPERIGRLRGLLARTNLFTRLLILVGLATLPAMAVMVMMQQNLRVEGKARMADEAVRQAGLLNADLTSIVEGARQISLAITHFRAVRAGDPACRADLLGLRADLPNYAMLSVRANDGSVICSTDASATATDATRTHMEDIIRRGRFDVGTFTEGNFDHGALVPFCLPFTLDSGKQAVVIAGLSLDWLGAHLGELKRPADSTIGIADRNGVTIARFPDHEKFVGKLFPPGVRPYINAPARGSAVVMGYDGRERMIGFVPATEAPVGLFASIGLYLPDMLADLDRVTLQGTLLMVTGALLSLLLALVVGQRFVRRPTEALLAAARRWTSGDLSARADLAEARGSEFGSLASAFNDMAGALGRQHRELHELNATLEARVQARTQDLTESRNRLQVEMAEREKTETSLRQAQKLQAVGQLAGGIAHDFNNLLTAVVGALDLLRARLPAGQEGLVRLLDNALGAAERGGKLTGQLLAFSRRQQLLPAPSDLNMTVIALTNLLGSTLGRSIRIQTDLVQDLWPAMVDVSQIEAAIINLAINARDAMPAGGVLTVATRNITQDPDTQGSPLPNSATSLPPGDYVAVRVTDTGTGMSQAVLARAFEPFFTTKPTGRGSGLGLSQVHGLAIQSGGDVRIDSRPGVGTTITLLIPRAATMPASRAEAGAARPAGGRGARVLVVDDDASVSQIVAEMLVERGYTVTTAPDAPAALDILRGAAPFDILLADYGMPGMDGAELIRAAETLRPGLRTLLMTGLAELRAGTLIDTAYIIRKPFNVSALDERLQTLLARPLLRVLQGGANGAA